MPKKLETEMDKEHYQHLAALSIAFVEAVEQKYKKGQKEHGGRLWAKPGLIDMAMDEVLDLWVYLYTLKEQINDNPRD